MTEQVYRLERGKQIALDGKLSDLGEGKWKVQSQFHPKRSYTVDTRKQTCTCKDFENWDLPCKHIYAVQFFKQPQEPKAVPQAVYRQNWPAYNQAQIEERQHFERFLSELCANIPQRPTQKVGRPRHKLRDVLYACALKVYLEKSGRRASSDLKRSEHFERVPHHNAISRYLLMPELTPLLIGLIEKSAAPLATVESQFAADATGFSTCTYVRWVDHKWGKNRRAQRWLKCHALVGVKTNVITSVQVTESRVNDTTMLPDLVSSAAKSFNMREVSADKAYLSTQNLLAIEAHQARPFIPFKSNSKVRAGCWERMWNLFWYQRERFLHHYHQRSNAETAFSMIKRKLGGALRSKRFESQVNETLCKVLCHNLIVLVHEMFELGIQPEWTR